MKLIDISGQRFGRLVVVSKAAKPRMWLCRCDCGQVTFATGPNLRRGGTRSCGCLAAEWSAYLGANRDYIAARAITMTRHGHKRSGGRPSPEYSVWLGMKRRCYDEKYRDYPRWGGRGIRVCNRWNHSFAAFLEDMGRRPSPDHSIDRLNSDGDYEPGNCRWATPAQQGGENRRGLVPLTVRGTLYPSAREACRSLGAPYGRTMMRLAAGRSIEEAFFATRADLARSRSRESYLPRSATARQSAV